MGALDALLEAARFDPAQPRDKAGRWIDVLGRLAKGEGEQAIVGDVRRQLQAVSKTEAVTFDVNGLKVETRAGSRRYRADGQDLGHSSMAAGQVVRMARERGDVETRRKAAADARTAPKARKGHTTFEHELPDGSVERRTSARAYSHVVTAVDKETGRRVVLSWSGSPEAAEKTRRDLARRGFEGLRVEPVRPPKVRESTLGWMLEARR